MSTLKQLSKLYRSLPYIIYKHKYLIPQPPYLKRLALINMDIKPFTKIQKHYPYLINDNVKRLFQQNKQEKLTEIYLNQRKKEEKQYLERVRQYHRMYIEPLKTAPRGLFPQIFFYRDYKTELKEKLVSQKRFSFKLLIEEYKKLEDQKKKFYELKCQQTIQQKIKQYNKCASKCMIPERTYSLPHIIYLRDTVQGPITSGMFGRYKTLAEQQKQKYRARALQLKKNDQIKLLDFLSSKQLNIHQFQYIKDICKKIEFYKKQRKLQNKKDKLKDKQNNTQNQKLRRLTQIGNNLEKQEQLIKSQFQEWAKQMNLDRQRPSEKEYTSQDVEPLAKQTFKALQDKYKDENSKNEDHH